MIQSKTQCPTEIQWKRFLSDDLDEPACESLEQHLIECHACASYFKSEFEMQSDSLEISVAAAIGASRNGISPDEPAAQKCDQSDAENELVNSLIERISGLNPRHDLIEQSLAQERAAEVLWLLEPGREPQSLGCLAHYDLMETLGAGSSGVVFAARDQLLQRVVAIKVLRPTLGATAQARFLCEARAIASLVHENIVTIYEVGQDQGLAYFTMPWLPGETLEKRLQRVTFLPEHETRELTKQICTALDAAHQLQLVHRDIKPANIWLDSKNGQCKLLDFGLARATELDVNLTATGVLAGTPSYMSPEQARGEELDHRSDLFSLGCLMYRCMTGRLPFVGNGILATLHAIQHREPTVPSELNSTCSADMSRLILALLTKDPGSRPASANEVRHAIDHSQVNWPFLPHANPEPTEPIGSPRTQTSTGSPAKAVRSGFMPPIRKVLVALAVGGFAFGLWQMLPDVLRIWTPQGEILIETEDPNVQIEVLQDGQLIHIIDTRSQRSLKIAAGTYSIQPGRSASDEATFKVTPGVVELTRGEQRIVKVTKVNSEKSPIEDTEKPGQTTSNSIQPTYQGRTLKQWIDILNAEQDFKTLATGIEAISLLVANDSPEFNVAVELVRKVMRQFGTDNNPGGPNHNLHVLRTAYDKFFSKIPPERTLEFLKSEMQHGNLNSFSYLWTLNHVTLGDSPVVEPLSKLIAESDRDLCEIYIKAVNSCVESNQLDEAYYLGYLAYTADFWQPKILQRRLSVTQGFGSDKEAFDESQRQINLEIGPTLLENRGLFQEAFR
ncbi:MAG: serine/threonine-protein kinase, partial [Pirellulaceae bacterium]|nr:serine/threonine-protein kinase [Pirellulaceae bacterium]